MKTAVGSLTWDLWLDFHAQDANGLTSALLEHARPGVNVEAGRYVLVGSDDSEFAEARVVSIGPTDIVSTRVLPGPASEHVDLLGR